MKAKCVVFPEAGIYETREIKLKKPGPRDIEVATLFSAISPGTERWILRGKHIGTEFPCVPGYHRIGVVKSRGREVKNFEPGNIVYGSASNWEGGPVSMWGAHVSASVGDEARYKLVSPSMPGGFELETAVFSTLAGVALRGVNACKVMPGERVIIIGGGFVGICAAQLCRFAGAEAAIVDKDRERVIFAKGFSEAFSVEDKNLCEKLEHFAPGGADVLYDTAGAPGATDALVKSLKTGGRLLLQAQYFDRAKCAIDLDAIKVRELTVKTTCGVSDRDWYETLEMILSRKLRIAPLITHRFNSREILKGYELLDSGKPFNMGIVFNW